jgi:hypothetical protein
MKPMMERELNQKNDPERLVRVVMHALESNHPKLNYRVGTGKMLALLEILPDRVMDSIYKFILR